ncbi:cellulose binding domain-containing protein [Actinacidiphila alni]|uniref:GH12 family glycosyl hydrolase domain-containing protein n=1 Tax=Actinacidiphila alni TaxID=380248 RepID=UPI0033BFC201
MTRPPARPRFRLPGRIRLRPAAAALAAVAALLLPLTAAQSAHADPVSTCAPQGTLPVAGGEYTLQANEWNSTAQQCLTATGGTAWSLSTANFNLPTNGAPATYPSLFKGCHWGDCTPNSGLPIQVNKLGSAVSSWSTVQPASGAYDVAYDLWINSTPTTAGQPDGTEIMIWLNSRGGVQPFGGKTGTSSAAGHGWDVWTGRQTSWKIISYVLQGGGTSLSGLDVKALIDDAVSRGSVDPAHYLIDAEAGFEVWQGGQGLATTDFSFSASTAGTGGGDTQAPTVPGGLTVTGTTATSASLSWSAATDNVGVTGYDVYRGGTLVGTTAGTSYTDSGLTAATAYTYSVRARDAAGNTSAASAAVAATTATGSNGGGGNGCSATYAVSNDWGSGFTADVTVANTGTAATRSWTVTWTYPGSQRITNSWNATVGQSGAAVTASSLAYNGALAPSAETHFGFQGTYSGTNAAPVLTCTAT